MEEQRFEGTIVNLTPHPITIFVVDPRTGERKKHEIPPSGILGRLGERDVPVGKINIEGMEVNVVKREYDLSPIEEILENITPPVILIVSLPVLQAIKSTGLKIPRGVTILVPDTSKGALRDEKGQIVGITQFVTL